MTNCVPLFLNICPINKYNNIFNLLNVDTVLASLANLLCDPLLQCLVLFVLAVAIRLISPKRKRMFILCFSVAVLWPFVWSQPYFAKNFIAPLEHGSLKGTPIQRTDNIDALFLLGCNYYDDIRAPNIARWPRCSLQRMMGAIDSYKRYRVPVIVTGGQFRDWDFPYAFYVTQFLVSHGVPPEAIIMLPYGYDTGTEVNAVATYTGYKKVGVVTSASHQLRVQRYLYIFGIQSVGIPVDYRNIGFENFAIVNPDGKHLHTTKRAWHEYLGLIEVSLCAKKYIDCGFSSVQLEPSVESPEE